MSPPIPSREAEQKEGPATAAPSVAPPAAPRGPQAPEGVLELQKSMGNTAVAALLTGEEPVAVPPRRVPASRGELDQGVLKALVAGTFNERGAEYEVDAAGAFVGFTNRKLQEVLDYYVGVWAPGVKDVTSTGWAAADSAGKPVASHPDWVRELQTKLMGQAPRGRVGEYSPKKPSTTLAKPWDEDSTVVQALISAYLNAWHRRFVGGNVPINVQELYARVGSSVTNAQTTLLGGYAGGPNWCGPASERAVALALMRRGWRFKGSQALKKPKRDKPPEPTGDAVKDARAQILHTLDVAESFRTEVTGQGSFFIGRWRDRGPKKLTEKDAEWRGVGGKPAADVALAPGDYIYVVNGNQGSPLSGHVATVVKEEPQLPVAEWKEQRAGTVLSKLYYVSGNARGVIARQGAVRVETVLREQPHPQFEYYETAAIGNQYDTYEAQRSAVMRLGKPFEDRMQQIFLTKFLPVARKIGAGAQRGKLQGKDGKLYDPGYYYAKYSFDAAAMGKYFSGVDGWSEYVDQLEKRRATLTPGLKKVDEDIAKLKEKAGTHPVTRRDIAAYDPANKAQAAGEKTGRYSPLDPTHSWVVSVVKASQFSRVEHELAAAEHARALVNSAEWQTVLDSPAKREAEARFMGRSAAEVVDEVLGRFTLERMPATVEQIWPGALDYWESRGAFR